MVRKSDLRNHHERTGPTHPFDRSSLGELAEAGAFPAVSLFLPTHRHASEKKEDRIRLRNLLRQAQSELEALGLRAPEAARLLEPAAALVDHDVFWEHQLDGLALFAGPGVFRDFSVPLRFREFAAAGEAFHLKPLLPLLAHDARYFVLALSQKAVALLEGARDALVEVPLPGLPQDLAAAIGLERFPPERSLQAHGHAPQAGRRERIFHGQAEEAEDAVRYLLDFAHKVEPVVSGFLRGERAPLLLAAVEYLHPIYAQVNTYPHLLAEGVHGNPDDLNVEELHRRSRAVVEGFAARRLQEALREYAERGGGPRSSEELSTVVVAAATGRVERLFVAEGEEAWGAFDPRTFGMTLHERRVPGDRDLLDFAAVRTLLADGLVYVLPRQRMPGRALAAALFRY